MKVRAWNFGIATFFVAAGIVGFFLDKAGWWLFLIFAAVVSS